MRRASATHFARPSRSVLMVPRGSRSRARAEEPPARDPCASWSRNLETPARVRRQHCDARCVRPPVLLGPRRTSRPARTTDELLDLTKRHAELPRGPRSLLATAAHVDIKPELPRRATDGQLIEHPVRGALQ